MAKPKYKWKRESEHYPGWARYELYRGDCRIGSLTRDPKGHVYWQGTADGIYTAPDFHEILRKMEEIEL